MAPKERRKGKKEIHLDNIETLKFYRKFSLIGSAIQVGHLLLYCFLLGSYSWWSVHVARLLGAAIIGQTTWLWFCRTSIIPMLFSQVFLVFGVGVHLVSHLMLRKLSTPYMSPEGVLLEAGADLNDSYIAEFTIDVVILTAGIQGLSAISNWFWLLWLLAPGYILYKFWTLLIWPWFTAGSPDTSEGKEGKKQKQKQKHRKVYVR